jgi:catechol 2,3-dioxygenase-like lactoylglutathione lyase family enzyme
MAVGSCIPIIPSKDIERSLRFWRDGLGFAVDREMQENGKLIFCMLFRDNLAFMLNQRAGTPIKPHDYHGIRLYWAPSDLHETRNRLKDLGYRVSEVVARDYGQSEFFLTDDDGFEHCFGVATKA